MNRKYFISIFTSSFMQLIIFSFSINAVNFDDFPLETKTKILCYLDGNDLFNAAHTSKDMHIAAKISAKEKKFRPRLCRHT